MSFTISTGLLLKHLSAIYGVIPSRPMLSVLENFLFKIEKNILTVTASDLNTTATIQILLNEANEEGNIAIPARMLIETLKSLPNQTLAFSVDFSIYTIEIRSEYTKGIYKLSCESGDDFPMAPKIDQTKELQIASNTLLEAIRYTLPTTSDDEMKPSMNGVYFDLRKDYMNFVSSDSHRLTCYKSIDIKSDDQVAFVIPKKVLSLLKGILPTQENDFVTLAFNSSNAIFTLEDCTLSCKLVEERFPDYENVIPHGNKNILTVNRTYLMSSLKRTIVYSNRSTNQIRFSIKENTLTILAEDTDLSNQAEEALNCIHEGKELEVGFNARYLIEMLSSLRAPEVVFKLAEPSEPVLLFQAHAKTEEEKRYIEEEREEDREEQEHTEEDKKQEHTEEDREEQEHTEEDEKQEYTKEDRESKGQEEYDPLMLIMPIMLS